MDLRFWRLCLLARIVRVFPGLLNAGAHEIYVPAQAVELIGKGGGHFHLVDGDFDFVQADEEFVGLRFRHVGLHVFFQRQQGTVAMEDARPHAPAIQAGYQTQGRHQK